MFGVFPTLTLLTSSTPYIYELFPWDMEQFFTDSFVLYDLHIFPLLPQTSTFYVMSKLFQLTINSLILCDLYTCSPFPHSHSYTITGSKPVENNIPPLYVKYLSAQSKLDVIFIGEMMWLVQHCQCPLMDNLKIFVLWYYVQFHYI